MSLSEQALAAEWPGFARPFCYFVFASLLTRNVRDAFLQPLIFAG